MTTSSRAVSRSVSAAACRKPVCQNSIYQTSIYQTTVCPTTIAAFLFLGLLSGSCFMPALWAEESRTAPGILPTPITRQEVWQAVVADLRGRGLADGQLPRAGDLDLPGAVPAHAGRTLRVTASCWDEGPRRTQFRLECGQPGQCLPFFVYARASANGGAGTCRYEAKSRAALKDAPEPAVHSLPPTIRNGDRATAVFLSERMRMTATVTCLDHGREGDVIRARAPDGHVFRARISGPALLEALPQ